MSDGPHKSLNMRRAWKRLFGVSKGFDELTDDLFRPVLHVPSHPLLFVYEDAEGVTGFKCRKTSLGEKSVLNALGFGGADRVREQSRQQSRRICGASHK